ncbi:60S ribosomal protein L18 [Entamoeba marina]
MGIDLERHHIRKHVSKTARGSNAYMKLLVRLYGFLARRSNSKFAKTIHHRLCLSRVNRPIISTSKIAYFMKKHGNDEIAVCTNTVTLDTRKPVPKMNVCALRFTKAAEAAIINAGGKCLKFDELALKAPTGRKTVLLRGKRNVRESVKHFGKVCAKKNAAKEYKGKQSKK